MTFKKLSVNGSFIRALEWKLHCVCRQAELLLGQFQIFLGGMTVYLS